MKKISLIKFKYFYHSENVHSCDSSLFKIIVNNDVNACFTSNCNPFVFILD